MWRDLRYGFRRFAGQKLFSAAVILLLTVGIGSNTVLFSFVDSLLLKPLPVRNPENLYLLQQMRKQQVRSETSFFYRQFEAIGRHKMFAAAVAEQGWAGKSFQALSRNDGVHLISTQIVSPNYFGELGVKAIAGRVLQKEDAVAFSDIPVVISEQCWNREFLRDAHVLNRAIRIRNAPFRVVGVLPSEFHGIDADRVPDVRVPIAAAPVLAGSAVDEPGGDDPLQFQILVRLAPGISAGTAASAMTPVLTRWEEPLWRAWYSRSSRSIPAAKLPEEIAYWSSYRVSLLPAGRGVSRLREQFSQTVVLLMGVAGLLLLVVCGNVAGLFLAKAEERNREIGVRLALGASRWCLVRQLYAENILLAVPGAVLGFLLALRVTPSLLRFLPTLGVGAYSPPTVLDVRPDLRVFAFVSAASLLTVAIFGFVPVRRAWLHTLNRQVAGGSRIASSIAANGVVALQIGLTMLLLSASLLVLKTFWMLNHVNPGFDQNHVIEAVIDPWDAGFSESQASALLRALEQRLVRLPGVRAVSFASRELMRGIGTKTTVVPSGSHLPRETFLNTSTNRVTPDYFESLGIPLVEGRNLDVRDVRTKPTPIVVNRAFVDYFLPGENPLGKAIVQGVDGTKAPTAVIVGVVGTAKYRSLREVDPPIYYAASDISNAGGVVYVRTRGDPALLIGVVRGVFRELAPTLPLASIYTLRQDVEASLWQERLIALLCMFFGLSALLLSAVGVYGALAYSVGRRLRELGIRKALGANPADIVRTVSARLAGAVALGILGGLGASALLLKLIKSLLFQVNPFDAPSFAFAATILLFCSAIAVVIPILRAIQMDPGIALRQE